MFDVAICRYDGVEVCELIGLYILHKSHQHTQKEASVCTETTGLAVFKNMSTRYRETKSGKSFAREILADIGLKITMQSNLMVVNYLDVTLNRKILSIPVHQTSENFAVFPHYK